MRWFAALAACVSLFAQDGTLPSLDRLFARPYVWGSSPSDLRWSRNGVVLLFTWNAEGNRFRDLYAWHPASKKRIRLTDLESEKDSLNLTPEEKDERQRRYLVPPEGITSFDVSDDGKTAAFAHKGDLYIAYPDGSRPLLRLTRTKSAEGSPRLSPDGKRLAFVRGGQLMVQNLAAGQIWQVTDIEGANFGSYAWSPDGKSILYQATKGTRRQLPLPNYSGRFVSSRQINRTVAGDEPLEVTLFLVPSEGGAARAIDRGGDKWTITSLEWAPDSKRVVVAHISPDWKTRRIGVVDVSSAKARQVFEEKDDRWVDYGFAAWSPDSKQVLFTSERTGWSHLYRVGAEGGEPVQITKGDWQIRTETFSQDPQWVRDWIYYSSTEAGTAERQFYRVRQDGTGKERLSAAEGLHIGLVSENGNNTALLRADEQNPFDLWVNDEQVTKSPRPEFYKYDWPAVRYVRFPSRGDGKQVAAKMLLPAGYKPEDKTRKWPAVVYIHGAGIATSVLKQWGSYNELRYVYNAFLASRGYIILDLDYRGSTGYGRDWRSDVYLHMGGRDLEDVLGGVDYLARIGNIDTNRLGIWGVSYGGFMTATALFKAPGVFRAGSAWSGVYDWENYNAGYTAQRLNTPASNPEAYRRSSPIHFSSNLKDNLLIVHGMVDDNVLFQDAVQLTEKLIHEGKDFAHIYYPEESHAFVREQTWVDALRRTTEWFARYLK